MHCDCKSISKVTEGWVKCTELDCFHVYRQALNLLYLSSYFFSMCFLVQGGSPPLHKASDQPPQKLPPGQPRVIERNRPEKRMFLLRKDIQVQLQPEKACGDFARGSDGALSHLWNPAEGPEDVEYALEKRSRENGSASLS